MRVVYTQQSLDSLEETLNFLMQEEDVPLEKMASIGTKLLNRADSLIRHPFKGQKEESLQHFERDHRRIIEGHIKIIYKVEQDTIYITDFFDSRQDPSQMKG